MSQLMDILLQKLHLVRISKVGEMRNSNLEVTYSYQDMMKIYENYRDLSVKEGVYYLKGSIFMKDYIEEYRKTPQVYTFFMNHFNRLDEKEPAIPLEIGLKLEELIRKEDTRLGMHRSDSIQDADIYSDPILHDILVNGLINNGMAMQGMVSSTVSPSQTVSSANDPILAIGTLKSSYKNSKGALLLEFPKKYIDNQFEINREIDPSLIYSRDARGITFIRPEYLIGFIRSTKDGLEYYSKDDLLRNYKKKELA